MPRGKNTERNTMMNKHRGAGSLRGLVMRPMLSSTVWDSKLCVYGTKWGRAECERLMELLRINLEWMDAEHYTEASKIVRAHQFDNASVC